MHRIEQVLVPKHEWTLAEDIANALVAVKFDLEYFGLPHDDMSREEEQEVRAICTRHVPPLFSIAYFCQDCGLYFGDESLAETTTCEDYQGPDPNLPEFSHEPFKPPTNSKWVISPIEVLSRSLVEPPPQQGVDAWFVEIDRPGLYEEPYDGVEIPASWLPPGGGRRVYESSVYATTYREIKAMIKLTKQITQLRREISKLKATKQTLQSEIKLLEKPPRPTKKVPAKAVAEIKSLFGSEE